MPSSTEKRSKTRTPVYFVSIGGPNFIEDTGHPAYAKLASIGRDITTKVQPKAIVVFSAHWQEHPTKIAINAAKDADIIYDFYNFPKSYYEVKYPNKGDPALAEEIAQKLRATGVEVEKVSRGLDHGVWAGFLAAFNPKNNPLNVPIVQVSLFDNEDLEQHYRLGQALESLRDEGVVIIGAGMASHNLPDFRLLRASGSNKPMPYTSSFEEALKDAAAVAPEDRKAHMLALEEREDFRQAHPSLDHILPMYVAAGAAGSDVGERLWTLPEGSVNWAQYRFGDVPSGPA